MKNMRIVGATLAVVIAGGAAIVATVISTEDSSAATAARDTRPATAADLELVPGSVGPIRIGSSKQQALDSGLFDADVRNEVDGCPTAPLAWKAPFAPTLDVQTLADGTVVSIGVRKAGPETEDGLGVGSTYAEVRAALPGAKAVAAGYGQSGVFEHGEDGWIGYLFDAPAGEVKAGDPVTFVEITESAKPGLMRDGC